MAYGNNNNIQRLMDLRAHEHQQKIAKSEGFNHGLTGRYKPSSVRSDFVEFYKQGFIDGKSTLGDQVTFAMSRA